MEVVFSKGIDSANVRLYPGSTLGMVHTKPTCMLLVLLLDQERILTFCKNAKLKIQNEYR